MVDSQTCLFEDGGTLELIRCNLVVTRLDRYAQFEGFNLQLFHKLLHALGYCAKIMVVHLLVFRR